MPLDKAIDLMLLPLVGSFFTYCITELFLNPRTTICDTDYPFWELRPIRDHYLAFYAAANLTAGLASFMVWRTQVDNFEPEALPLTMYGFTIFFHWIQYPLMKTKIQWALIDSTLASAAGAYTTKAFYDVMKPAAFGMIPLLFILAEQTAWNAWCYKQCRSKRKR